MSESKKEIMSERERLLKKKLIALLKDDGKGHYFERFAYRLEDFIIKIVPLDKFPWFTAGISFDDGTIAISDGFLDDDDTFFQLNVLMRHELAHSLLTHQIRARNELIKKYGKDGAIRMQTSHSFHDLLNDIEDFEVCNEIYINDDKDVVRFMKLNGELIGGLITEDHMKEWQKMTLEEMQNELVKYIDRIHEQILNSWKTKKHSSNLPIIDAYNSNIIDISIKALYCYAYFDAKSNFLSTISKFIDGKGVYHLWPYDEEYNGQVIIEFKTMPNEWQDIIKKIYAEFNVSTYTIQELNNIILDICKSNPQKEIEIKNKSGDLITTLYSPEEKLIAEDVLKKLNERNVAKKDWLDNVKAVLSDNKFTNDDLLDIQKVVL